LPEKGVKKPVFQPKRGKKAKIEVYKKQKRGTCSIRTTSNPKN